MTKRFNNCEINIKATNEFLKFLVFSPDSLILTFTIKTRFLFQTTLSGHDNYIHSLALKNGNTCASASEDGTVRIWGNYDL